MCDWRDETEMPPRRVDGITADTYERHAAQALRGEQALCGTLPCVCEVSKDVRARNSMRPAKSFPTTSFITRSAP